MHNNANKIEDTEGPQAPSTSKCGAFTIDMEQPLLSCYTSNQGPSVGKECSLTEGHATTAESPCCTSDKCEKDAKTRIKNSTLTSSCTQPACARESDLLAPNLGSVPTQSCCSPSKTDKCCTPSSRQTPCEKAVTATPMPPQEKESCCTATEKSSCCSPPSRQRPCPEAVVVDPASPPQRSSCCTMPKVDKCGGSCQPLRSSECQISIVEKDNRQWKQATFQVEGMTCTGCENTLNAALQTHPSIHDAKPSMFLNKVELSYDPAALTPADIVDIINATGFTARLQHSAAGNQACFLISHRSSGLDLEKDRDIINNVLKLQGIIRVDVMSHASGYLVDMVFDPEITGTRDIANALRSNGFDVKLANDDNDNAAGRSRSEMIRMRLLFVVSIVFVIPVILLAFVFPDAGTSEIVPDLSVRNLVLFLLTTPIQLYVGAPIYRGAWNGLILSRELNMDSLVVLSTSCAYFYSAIAIIVAMSSTRYEAPEVFFETSAILMTLIILGRFMQASARGRAADALSKLKSLQSSTANLVVVDSHGNETLEKIESGYLQRRDVIKVLPSERIPADGVVISGTADVDESNMTGESVPVSKGTSDEVTGGSLNMNGTLLVRVTRVQSESKLNDITKLVEQAQASKAPSQALADKIAAWFTPFVIALGFITYLVWLILGLQGKVDTSKYPSGVLALTYAIAVLVVSCPCAIALAVPTVIVVGTGVGARHGILVKDGGVFEDAASITHVVLDKTGTLTQGHFQVVDYLELQDIEKKQNSFDLAYTAASNSEHPLSLAVAYYCGEKSSRMLASEESTAFPGFGIACKIQGNTVRVGKVDWVFEGSNISTKANEFLSETFRLGRSVVAVSVDSTPLLLFALEDGLRLEAAAVVNHLKASGFQVYVISGDHQSAVDNIARQLCIEPDHAIGNCTPTDKLNRLAELQAAGNAVLFCGDGTNDAPVLAQANVGLAMSTGTSSGVAIATAKAVLLTNDLRGVIVTLDLARRVMARIRINFAWAFLYNLVVIPLAAGCFIPVMKDVRIPPEVAGLGELLSVMPVLAVALLLKRYTIPTFKTF